jgi:ribonuclease HI
VFTDGSSEDDIRNGGAGILIELPSGDRIEKSIATGNLSDCFRAERAALELAANFLLNLPISPNSQIVFLTDAKSVLQSLKNSDVYYIQSLKTALTILKNNSKETVLQWIPAHSQIQGNETADKLAKLGSKSQQPEIPLHPVEVKKIFKNKLNQSWSDSHPNHCKNDAYYKLSRHDQRIIFRLRTGHSRMKQHMFRKMKIGTSDTCPCGMAPENTEHVLQACSLYQQARSSHWPQDTPLKDKLYGELAELETTVQYITDIGLTL